MRTPWRFNRANRRPSGFGDTRPGRFRRRWLPGKADTEPTVSAGSKRETTVARMKSGERGTVLTIQGGHGLARRLHALGVRPGKRVRKVGSMFMRGPVTIQIDNTQIALGFGMADKVVVELDSK